jgi:tetratricopeptide (TPR) repeat protein
MVPLIPSGFALGDPTTDAAILWSDSIKAESNGDYAGALVKMDQLANVFPDPYLVNIRKGWLSYMNHDYVHAVYDYHQASSAAPDAITPYIGLVYSYRAAGLTQNTVGACNDVLKHDPQNTIALKMLASISYEQTDFATAAHYYQVLVDAHPEEPVYLSGLGWSYLKLGKNDLAVRFFQRLLILSPDYAYAQQGYAAALPK